MWSGVIKLCDTLDNLKSGNLIMHQIIIKFHTFLSQSNPVVLQEDDFKTVSHYWVIVHHLSNSCDESDDHLGHVIPWSSLRKHSVTEKYSRAKKKKRVTLPIQIQILGKH